MTPSSVTPGRKSDSLVKLSKIASEPVQHSNAMSVKTAGLNNKTDCDIVSDQGIETIALSPSDSVRSASPSSPSPPPDTDPHLTVSRCRPYTPKQRPRPGDNSDHRTSTPKKMFVRPFEDDYSPIPATVNGDKSLEDLSSTNGDDSVNKDCAKNNIDLEDCVKPEDQDSDYESMSSDSSVKKDVTGSSGVTESVVSVSNGVSDHEESVFREPSSDTVSPVSRKDKLKYLRYFRLITHRKKNEVELKKLERRKERLRERSPSPPSLTTTDLRCTSPELPLPSVPPHLNKLSETHAKVMYLSAIGLCRNTEEQKMTHEQMWSVILEDRLTRDQDSESVTTKYFIRLRDMSSAPEPSDLTSSECHQRGVKRSVNGEVATGETSPTSSPPHTRYNGLNIPTSDALSRLSSDHTPVMSLPSSVEINLCSLQPIAKPTLLLQEADHSTAAPPAHLQHPHCLPAVLQHPVNTEPEDLSVNKKRKCSTSSYQWPGVEAILESYKKFTTGTD